MKITKREVIIAVGTAVIVVLVVIIWFWVHGASAPSQTKTSGSASQTNGFLPASAKGTISGVTVVTAVPANTVAPNSTSTGVSAGVAVPVVQTSGDPSGNVSYRSFNISISGGKYSPNTVIVKQGDTVNLEMTAVDANYGFTLPTYGMNGVIAQGKKQTIQFQALQVGDFLFYCASCGGPSAGPTGHLIVTAK